MYTLFRLSSDELDDRFLQSLRTLFKGKTIEISVCEAAEGAEDETAYLLASPANRRRLLEAVGHVEQGLTVPVDLDALK